MRILLVQVSVSIVAYASTCVAQAEAETAAPAVMDPSPQEAPAAMDPPPVLPLAQPEATLLDPNSGPCRDPLPSLDVAKGCAGGLASAMIEHWLSGKEIPTGEELTDYINGWSRIELSALLHELDLERRSTHVPAERRRIDRLRRGVSQAISALDPWYYPVDGEISLNNDCFKDIFGSRCNDRFAGFSAAAVALHDGQKCWVYLHRVKDSKGAEFKKGYLDWWHEHTKEATCDRPVRPPRCLLAWCSEDYSRGLAFRPSVQLGATFGEGLGFSNDASFAGQFSGSLGARLFLADDWIDVHGAAGIGTSTVDVDGVEGGDSTTAAFILLQAGLGFVNGLFGVSYIHTFDPRESGPGAGNGVSIFADAAAAERLIKE